MGPPLPPEHVEVALWRAAALAQWCGLPAEREERGSVGGQQAAPRWWWQAIEHPSGTGWADVFGRRQADGLLPWPALLAPWPSTRFSTAGWGADERHRTPEPPVVGKPQTQKMASKPSKLRTRIKRLVRRTICFSKTTTMHDLVVGLFINRYAFGRPI